MSKTISPDPSTIEKSDWRKLDLNNKEEEEEEEEEEENIHLSNRHQTVRLETRAIQNTERAMGHVQIHTSDNKKIQWTSIMEGNQTQNPSSSEGECFRVGLRKLLLYVEQRIKQGSPDGDLKLTVEIYSPLRD